MEENRVVAYLNLIDELLSCPSGEELALLKVNQELVDADLVMVMEQAAAKLTGEGKQEAADLLQRLATQISNGLVQNAQAPEQQQIRSQAYMSLIEQLVSCPNGQEPEVLDANPELIDAGFVQTIVQVATGMAHQGNQDTSQFLIHIARELSKSLGLYPDLSPSSVQSSAGVL